MADRQRLLERVFSREGAAEAPEDHNDPITGEIVRMTPSQWALAEYDRRHGPVRGDTLDARESNAQASGSEHDSALRVVDVDDGALHAADLGSGAKPPARNRRRALPYLAAAGGVVLGVALTIGIQGALGSKQPQSSTDSGSSVTTRPAGALATDSGQGDEGATLAAVNNYFANAPRVHSLQVDVTRGFDATSFHLVAGTAQTQESSVIYAARRLDDNYCLVAVAKAGRNAETCGTMDDIARRGLILATQAVPDIGGQPVTVTVTWQTDGTLASHATPAVR